MRISDWSSDVCSSDLQAQQFACLFIRSRGGGYNDIHASHLIDAIIVDFRKNNLFLDAESIIAVSIERLRIKTTEIANTRHRDRHQTIQELIHPFAAQRNLRANGHAFTQLELSNRLLRLRDHWLLTSDQFHFLSG